MGKFYIHLVFFVSLVLIIISVLISLPGINNDYSMIYDTKVQQIQTLKSPKLVLLGGSSVAFGYNTKILADSLHINAYNYAITSEFGQKYIIDDIERFMSSDDILVISLEYITFLGSVGCKTEMCELLFRNKHVNWKKLNLDQITTAVSGLPLICRTNFNRLFFQPKRNDGYFHYTKLGFNEYGDEESHWRLIPQMDPIKENSDYDNCKINEEFVIYYISQLKHLEERGVKIVCLPGIMGDSEYLKEKIYMQKFVTFWKNNGGTIDGEVMDYIVPDSFLYDYPYHLNKVGVDYITKLSINDIRRTLSETTSIQ